ncbi:MAG: hypothetical protein ACT4QF_22380 [Sporichthyaceae bacterium]
MKTVLGVGLMFAAILPGSAAQAAEVPNGETIRSRIVESQNKKISCYALKQREAVHCKGRAYSSDSDKVVELGKRGKAKRVRVSDYPGYDSEPKKLDSGDTWRRNGVQCRLGSGTITCFNLDGHGFHIGKKSTKTF